MQFDKGMRHMITNSDKMIAEYADVAMLITDKKLARWPIFCPCWKIGTKWQRTALLPKLKAKPWQPCGQ